MAGLKTIYETDTSISKEFFVTDALNSYFRLRFKPGETAVLLSQLREWVRQLEEVVDAPGH